MSPHPATLHLVSLHLALIAVHATAAVIALVLCLLALRFPRLVGAQALATMLMTLALAGAEVLGFRTYQGALLIVFPGLLVLAGYATLRSFAAWRTRPAPGDRASGDYVSSLGFTAITLAAGFLAILALRAGLGPIGIAVGVLAPIMAGRMAIQRMLRTGV